MDAERAKFRLRNRDELRSLVATSTESEQVVQSLEVTIERAKPPRAGWVGAPGLPVTSLAAEWTDSGFHGHLTFPESVSLAVGLAAVVRMCTPVPTGHTQPDLMWAQAALPNSGLMAETLRSIAQPGATVDQHLRATDSLIISESVASAQSQEPLPHGSASTISISQSQWTRGHHCVDVFVDPLVHRPLGRRSNAQQNVVAATSLELPEYLDTAAVRSLREITGITGSEFLSPQQRSQVQACGVVLDAPVSEHASVAARSIQLRHHTAQPFVYGWPSVTMVLVTNRPEFLHRIVEFMATQTYPQLELVLLTHGFELDDHIAAHLAGLRFPAVHQAIPREVNLGEALAIATSLSSGELVTKIDDDDFYGPEHVWDLVVARMYSGGNLVGKTLDNIYIASQDRTVFRPTYAAEKYATFVAGGTILISQGDLREVGGWRPVPKSVDRALLDRVLGHGGLVYRTHGLGYIYVRHGDADSGASQVNTSQVSDSHFETKVESSVQGLNREVLRGYGLDS